MNRSLSSSRRRFLTGAAVGATAALAGCTSVYGTLPNRVTYARTRRRGVPSVPAAIETTDDHLRDLAAEIDAYADGLEVWDRIDGPERGVVYSDRGLEDALEFADSLSSEPPTTDTIETAGYHLSQAAGSDAYARVRADEFDRDPTAGAERWLDERASVHADFEDERRDVHSALYSRSQGERVETINRIVDGGYEVYGTVELVTLWLRLAAARAERDRLEAADEDRLDSGLVDAAKRAAVDRLENVLESDPDPLALFFADRARLRFGSGDRGLDRRSRHDDEDWRWSQANSYAHYLLAKGTLDRIDEAVDVLATGD